MVELNKVTILVTTFLRPQHLSHCLRTIRKSMSECQVVVTADDDLPHEGIPVVRLPYDSGLTPKRNAAVKQAHTPYCLLASDDFEFTTETHSGVEKMVETLDAHPEVDLVVGTYNDMKYEGHLIHVPGEYIKEQYTKWNEEPIFAVPHPAWKIDLGINYFLARTEVLLKYPWDESIVPIGGEHSDFFLTLKEAGRTVVFVKDCNVRSFSIAHEEDPAMMKLYYKMRNRAQQGHALYLKKRGLKRYYGFRDAIS